MAKDNINAQSYKDALKAADKLLKTHDSLKRSSSSLNGIWDSISSNIFGVSGANWFEEVPKTTQELIKQNQKISEIDASLNTIGRKIKDNLTDGISEAIGPKGMELANKFTSSFLDKTTIIGIQMSGEFGKAGVEIEKMGEYYDKANAISKMGGDEKVAAQKELNKLLKEQGVSEEASKDFMKQVEDSHGDSVKFFKEAEKDLTELQGITNVQLKQDYLKGIHQKDLTSFVAKHKDEAIKIIVANKKLNKLVGKESIEYNNINKKAEKLKDELKKTTKPQLTLIKGFRAIVANFARGIIPNILKFDSVLHSGQKNFGINMVDNTEKFSLLTQKTSEFGMSAEDAMNFMGGLGDELKTTDYNVLSQAADDLKAIQLATGISSENLSKITGEMMRNGKSSKDVEKAMSGANVVAKQFGVNTKSVLGDVAKNIDKMRTMGFVGGEESLTRMIAKAKRLRMNVDEIFDMSNKARNVEGAMKMAAELQLAGGSFAHINPMDLLSAARKGPKELQKILTSMGDDIGHFNKKGQYKFDPVDIDRLKIVADATGQTIDSLTNMISKKKQDNEKLKLFPDQMFQIDGLDPDAIKAQISDAIEVDKDGNMKIKADNIFGANSIADLKNMSKDDIKARLAEKAAKDAQLEEQATQNQSFKEVLKAFGDSFMNLLTMVQPVFEVLGGALQSITHYLNEHPVVKGILGLTAALLLFGGVAVPKFISASKGLISGIGKTFGLFSKGFKGIGGKIAGAFSAGKKGGDALGAVTNTAKDAEKIKPGAGKGLKGFVTSLAEITQEGAKIDWKGLLKLAASIALLSGSLALVAGLYTALGGDPMALIALGLAMVELAGSIWIVSKAKVNEGGIIKMALAMAIIGAAMVPFAYAATMLTDVDWGAVIVALGIMLLAVYGLMSMGASLVGPQITALAVGALALVAVGATLLLFAYSMKELGEAFKTFTEVDWGKLINASVAMFSMIPALAAFAIAGLLFVNPITLFGMLAMLGVLGMMASILIPLAESLTSGASALESMAGSVEKLNQSLGNLDFDKLKDLKEISEGFAEASSGGGQLAAALDKLASSTNGGGGANGSGGRTKTLVVQLKMPNGRVLEEHIINDIEKAT